MLREKRYEWARASFERLIGEDSCDKGEAAYCLAIMHHIGSGIQKSLDEAAKYYLVAKQQGHPMATYRLATIYEQRGELQNAYQLYCAAADTVPSAAYWAYRLLNRERILDDDPQAAEKYLNSAAEKGHVVAERTIAMRYLCGEAGLLKIPYGVALFCKALFHIIQVVIIKSEKMRYE
jgi:TPR repeat protein